MYSFLKPQSNEIRISCLPLRKFSMLFLISFYPWVNICFIMNRLIAHGFSNAKELLKFLLIVDWYLLCFPGVCWWLWLPKITDIWRKKNISSWLQLYRHKNATCLKLVLQWHTLHCKVIKAQLYLTEESNIVINRLWRSGKMLNCRLMSLLDWVCNYLRLSVIRVCP